MKEDFDLIENHERAYTRITNRASNTKLDDGSISDI